LSIPKSPGRGDTPGKLSKVRKISLFLAKAARLQIRSLRRSSLTPYGIASKRRNIKQLTEWKASQVNWTEAFALAEKQNQRIIALLESIDQKLTPR